jgi:hypothetical protein
MWFVAACCAALLLCWNVPAAAAGAPPKPDPAPAPTPDRAPAPASAPRPSHTAPQPRAIATSTAGDAAPARATNAASSSNAHAQRSEATPAAARHAADRPAHTVTRHLRAAPAQRQEPVRLRGDFDRRPQAAWLPIATALPAAEAPGGLSVSLVIAAMLALALVLVGACAVPVAVAARIGVPRGFYEHRGDVSLVVVAATVAVALVLFVTSIMSGSG